MAAEPLQYMLRSRRKQICFPERLTLLDIY